MNEEYWKTFWLDYTQTIDQLDDQAQVLRTRDRKPISQELWRYTLSKVIEAVEPSKNDDVLDLCCGNGMLSMALAPLVNSITAVDLSPQLIAKLDSKQLKNVTTAVSDISEIEYDDGRFSKIVWYAGIQYLNEAHIVAIFKKMHRWLRPDGKLFIGDIPDKERMWSYFNTPEREFAFFEALRSERPIIGTWIQKNWLIKLAVAYKFKSPETLEQDPKLIYSDFRYDFVAKT